MFSITKLGRAKEHLLNLFQSCEKLLKIQNIDSYLPIACLKRWAIPLASFS